MYHKSFCNVFKQLKADSVFTQSIPEIKNSNLFKLLLFKALTED